MAKLVNEKPQLPKPARSEIRAIADTVGHIVERLSTYLYEYAYRLNRTIPKDGSENADFIALVSSASAVPSDSSARAVIYMDASSSQLRAKLPDGNIYTLAPSSAASDIKSITEITSAHTALTSQDVLLCDGAFQVTLYTAIGNQGREITVKNLSGGAVSVTGISAGETIDNLTSQNIGSGVALKMISDNAVWHII